MLCRIFLHARLMINKSLTLLLVAVLPLTACLDNEDPNADFERRLSEQVEEIETYLADNNINATATNGYYLEQITENPSGKTPEQEDVVLAYYELQTLAGELVARVSQADGDEPETIPYIAYADRVILPLALYEILGEIRAGEEVRVFLPFNRAYVSYELPNVFPAYSAMILRLQVAEVLSPDEFALRQDARIKTYLADNNLQPADSLEGGVYYHQTQAGESPEVGPGNTVRVRYTGSFLDGTEFDSNVDNATPFRVNMSEGGVISGFKTALFAMSQAEEGVAILPAYEAYGPNFYAIPREVANDLITQGVIPGQARLGPYTILRFDLEVEAVN